MANFLIGFENSKIFMGTSMGWSGINSRYWMLSVHEIAFWTLISLSLSLSLSLTKNTMYEMHVTFFSSSYSNVHVPLQTFVLNFGLEKGFVVRAHFNKRFLDVLH